MKRKCVSLSRSISVLFFASTVANAFTPMPAGRGELIGLSLEQLADLEVTSVSKRPERQSSAAAAVSVITADEIRRAGVTSIPEALRLAPGVQVARINSNQWSIGIRGFGSRLARSVLVLIDGRSVYSPLFAGTYWEIQDVLLEDIDRIEVIRGPGGTLYGANAFNGVINIITKHTRETHGAYLTAGGGTLERHFAGGRYGAGSDQASYRVYGKYFDRGETVGQSQPAADNWIMGQGGFRSDWRHDTRNQFTVQGDVYQGRAGNQVSVSHYTPPFAEMLERQSTLTGSNLIGRWDHEISEKSSFELQTYYDYTRRKDPHFYERRHTYDIDLHHHGQLFDRHWTTWGVDFRATGNRTEAIDTINFDPSHRTDYWAGVFVQDEIVLIPERLHWVLGSKFEHNDYSGWELQPNTRLAWTPDTRHTVWASVSRAVRTPTATDEDLSLAVLLDPGTTTFARVEGNKDFKSEKVTAYELGYRAHPVERVLIDVAGFYNHYNDLLSLEPQSPVVESTNGVSRVVIPYQEANRLKADSAGVGASATWTPASWWRIRTFYTYVDLDVSSRSDSADVTSEASTEGSSPAHVVLVHSSFDLTKNWELDPVIHYVDTLSAQAVPSYWSMDLRLAWRPRKEWEVAVVGQNLLEPQHAEWGQSNLIQRGVYGQVVWRSW
jgi:iron complex outermembrane recepter protein